MRRIVALGSASADALGADATVRSGSCTVSKHVYGYRLDFSHALSEAFHRTSARCDVTRALRFPAAQQRIGDVCDQDVLGEHRRRHRACRCATTADRILDVCAVG